MSNDLKVVVAAVSVLLFVSLILVAHERGRMDAFGICIDTVRQEMQSVREGVQSVREGP